MPTRAAEFLQQSESVDVGHREIQHHQVRRQLLKKWKSLPRIVRAPEIVKAAGGQNPLQQVCVYRLVIYDEDLAVLQVLRELLHTLIRTCSSAWTLRITARHMPTGMIGLSC